MNTSLKKSSGDFWKQGHKHLPLAFLNYNSTYHTSTGFEHRRIFQRCVFYNLLDHKFQLKIKTGSVPTAEFADDLLRRTHVLNDRTKNNVMQSNLQNTKDYATIKQKPHRCKKMTTAIF